MSSTMTAEEMRRARLVWQRGHRSMAERLLQDSRITDPTTRAVLQEHYDFCTQTINELEPTAHAPELLTPDVLRGALKAYMETESEGRYAAGWLIDLHEELRGDTVYDSLVAAAGGTWTSHTTFTEGWK